MDLWGCGTVELWKRVSGRLWHMSLKMSVTVTSFVGLAERITTKNQPYMKKLDFMSVLHEVIPKSTHIIFLKKEIKMISAYWCSWQMGTWWDWWPPCIWQEPTQHLKVYTGLSSTWLYIQRFRKRYMLRYSKILVREQITRRNLVNIVSYAWFLVTLRYLTPHKCRRDSLESEQ